MKDWELDELVEAVRESLGNFVRGGLDSGQAAERCLYEYESTMNEGEAEKTVVMATLGVILADSGAISKRQFEKISASLDSYETLKDSLELEPRERAGLGELVQKARTLLASVKAG